MNKILKIGKYEITWLNGGKFALDGGAMFGVVPKKIWVKQCQVDQENYMPIYNNVLLISSDDTKIIVESGLGNKLTEKQKKIFRVEKEWSLLEDLKLLGVNADEIDYLILTHCDFDHAGGVVSYDENLIPELTFKNAKHVIQKIEWQDAIEPNIRSANTYWPQNFTELREDNILLVEGEQELIPGIKVQLTGGHTNGHQVVAIESDADVAIHMADLLPTHFHANPLWIMSYDNFPLESISAKKTLLEKYINKNAWFTFYHDEYLACKFNEKGVIVDKLRL